jgi:hypothetical protein
MLMVRLILDMLSRRSSGGPVPILASVASWNPAEQDLRDWLSIQLIIDHPALASPRPAGLGEPTKAAALLAAGLILPVLDGLDEIPEHVRGPAISRINDALRPGERVVVTCRTQQYRDAVRPPGGVGITLRAAAAVELRPLDADAVRSYLLEDAGGHTARVRWESVLDMLGTATPAGQALRTPLMVGLARAIYNPRPGELAGTLRDPAELLRPVDQKAVESLLFDEFISAAYRPPIGGRWKARQAQRWLVFLARHLEQTVGGPDLAWWQLRRAIGGFVYAARAAVGVILGLLIGLFIGAGLGFVIGIFSGTYCALWVAFRSKLRASPEPIRGIRWRPPSRGTIVFGAVTLIVFGLVAGVGHRATPGIIVGGGVGAAVVAVGWTMRQRGAPHDLGSAASPGAVLSADRRTGSALGALAGVIPGALIGFLVGGGSGPFHGGITGTTVFFQIGAGAGTGAWVLCGFGVWLLVGVVWSFALAAWPSYDAARIWLAFRHRLPWSLMDFLEDAHRRGVLRQVGAVYQFRHIELQHRLANRDASAQQAVSSSPAAGAVQSE